MRSCAIFFIAVALAAGISVLLSSVFAASGAETSATPLDPMQEDVTQGALRIRTEEGVVECPLKHTDIKAVISGFIARVSVTQTFYNPLDERIEAVYVFPLPHKAAVDEMI